jgi:preprotein translocase subunit SecA
VAPLGGVWGGRRRSEELVIQALTARELYRRDLQYVVDEGKVVIVDESTGRLMPDRTWRAGLHQAVEAREGLEIQPPKDTLARISFQRFFRQYRHICGMTGTGWEARHELWQVFELPTVVLPTHRPCIRIQRPDRITRDVGSKWDAVVEEIVAVHAEGRPVLVGTRSVDDSEYLSRRLTEAGLEHQVLNAVRHAEEAQIVAGAGKRDQITVATNMAGRGTDIKLGEGVRELGGLHVVATDRYESGRVDRQLYGRAGRQGDPGSAVTFVSLDDDLSRRHTPRLLRPFVRAFPWPSAARATLALAQRRAGRVAARRRRSVLKTDDWLDKNLGFSG